MSERGGLLPAYLVVGADELKRQATVKRLKRRLDEGFSAFNLDERVGNADIEAADLIASLNTLPLGDVFRLVLVERADKLSKPVSEALIAYLTNPNPSTVLCLVAESLAKSTRLYKAVAKVGKQAVIECAPPKRWELPPRVVKMASTYGVRMDQQAAEELVSRVGESMTLIDAQVKGLADYCRDRGTITLEDVEYLVVRTAEVKPWDFLDAVSARNTVKALSLYQLMQNPSHIALCSMLSTRITELICARSLDERGEGPLLAQELGKQSWQVKNHMAWARRFREEELRTALIRCARCERDLKTGLDPDLTFTTLVLEICRT